MSDETTGPSPEEIGEKETGPISKEEMGEKFETFIHDENKHASFSTRVVNVEKDKLFDIVDYRLNPDLPRTILRQYWGYNPGETNVPFSVTGEATIDNGGKILTLEKIGRRGLDVLERRDENERLELYKPDIGGFGLRYTVSNIKGEALRGEDQGVEELTSVISVGYDSEGGIKYLNPIHRSRPEGLNEALLDMQRGRFNNLDNLKEFAEKGDILEMEGVRLKIEFDHNAGSFMVTMFDMSGKPEYKVIVPERVDLENIRAETGADELLADPYQPAEGISGKSVGDTDWRYKSFPDLTGIIIVPIDTKDSIPGPK